MLFRSDRTVPVDIDHIDIYGYTGVTPPPRDRIAEAGTLVATTRQLGLIRTWEH